MSRLQLALVATLLVATAVFAVGAIAERSRSDTHAEPAATRSHEASEGAGGEETAGAEDQSEELLGVDTESAPLIALTVIAGLGLAAVAASSLGRRSGVLIAIALLMAVWAALDAREVVHQLEESRTGIAVAAMIAAALHLTAVVLAARARHADLASPGRTGTMPA